MSSWKELAKIADRFRALDVRVLGVSADTPADLRRFREKLDLPFTMLSDPMLATASALDVPVASRANFTAVSVIHPTVRTYPRRSFMQPALFVWGRDGTLRHQWRQTESSLTNLYGARGRPRADSRGEFLGNLAEPALRIDLPDEADRPALPVEGKAGGRSVNFVRSLGSGVFDGFRRRFFRSIGRILFNRRGDVFLLCGWLFNVFGRFRGRQGFGDFRRFK